MKLLLIGATGSPYYRHCEAELRNFLGASARVGVIPAANTFNTEEYFEAIAERFAKAVPPISESTVHIRWDANWQDALDRVDAVIIPGGNTYVLLQRLKHSGLFEALRCKIAAGVAYVGSSAGANVAGPNILTTNDWNIVGLRDFTALGLVPFNVNPHYVERGAWDAANSESRDYRIREYHQFNNNPVVAIEEDGVLGIVDATSTLVKGRAKVFLPDSQQFWMDTGRETTWRQTADKRRAAS
jgi:dipeptidase E